MLQKEHGFPLFFGLNKVLLILSFKIFKHDLEYKYVSINL